MSMHAFSNFTRLSLSRQKIINYKNFPIEIIIHKSDTQMHRGFPNLTADLET